MYSSIDSELILRRLALWLHGATVTVTQLETRTNFRFQAGLQTLEGRQIHSEL